MDSFLHRVANQLTGITKDEMTKFELWLSKELEQKGLLRFSKEDNYYLQEQSANLAGCNVGANQEERGWHPDR